MAAGAADDRVDWDSDVVFDSDVVINESASAGGSHAPTIRKDFPESWIWETLDGYDSLALISLLVLVFEWCR
jgi:hypothetical protein